MASLTDQTMELLKKLQSDGKLEKLSTTVGITTGTGIVNYNLEPYAKTLYPVITPIRNRVARFTNNNGGNAVNWKQIIAINPSRIFPGTTEGIRGAVIDQTEQDRTIPFCRLSLENSITEEAIMQAEGFDNALAVAADNLLRSMFIAEEEWMLVGNGPTGLTTPVAPVGTVSAGGSMTAQATYCFVFALTYDGWKRASLTNGLVSKFTKSSAMNESQQVNGGVSTASPASAAATTTTSPSNQTVTWAVTAVKGAFGYAWFVGTAASLASCTLAGITSINSFKQTADAGGTQLGNANAGIGVTAALGATNYSQNSTVYDGLIIQALGGNGYYKSLDGAPLTGNPDGSVVEIDDALQSFYDTWKISPTRMIMSTQEARNLTAKALAAPANGAFRINISQTEKSGIVMGGMVSAYLNKFAVGGPKELVIEIHPNMPAGYIFFDCDEIPYPLANIPGPYRMNMLRDYYQRLWPQITETRFTSVNTYGALQVYVPFSMGLLANIGKG